MPDKTIRLSRRRFLASFATIGGASATTGAGTTAYFADTERSSGNTVQAGSIDLTLEAESEPVTFFQNDTAIQPGEENAESIVLDNAGSIEGTVELVLDDVTSSENERNSSERAQDDESPDEGELQDFLELRAELDETELIGWTRARNLFALTLPESYRTDTTIAPETGGIDFTIEWRFITPGPPNHKDVNAAQGDSIALDIIFRLVQTGGT